uniref:Uncharacterized protein n=1 Tax=Fagus sylvatica TaxID=28930 RepID=A0A2N9HSA7_FAGSY
MHNNLAVHNGVVVSNLESKILEHLQTFKPLVSPAVVPGPLWNPPQPNVIKLNVDAPVNINGATIADLLWWLGIPLDTYCLVLLRGFKVMILAMLKQLLFPRLWKLQFLKASLTSLLNAMRKSALMQFLLLLIRHLGRFKL